MSEIKNNLSTSLILNGKYLKIKQFFLTEIKNIKTECVLYNDNNKKKKCKDQHQIFNIFVFILVFSH